MAARSQKDGMVMLIKNSYLSAWTWVLGCEVGLKKERFSRPVIFILCQGMISLRLSGKPKMAS